MTMRSQYRTSHVVKVLTGIRLKSDHSSLIRLNEVITEMADLDCEFNSYPTQVVVLVVLSGTLK